MHHTQQDEKQNRRKLHKYSVGSETEGQSTNKGDKPRWQQTITNGRM